MSSAPLPVASADLDTNAPCLRCGACCATYRVSFYWAEAEAQGLDARWTESLTPWLACMAGTSKAHPRCAALTGQVGDQVACQVYPSRPQACREVAPGSDQCQRARVRHGLGMLTVPPIAHDALK